MENACREMTVRELIVQMGNTKLCHDYEGEAKRILALYDEENENLHDRYYEVTKAMERKIREQEIIISCLAKCAEVR